jgi:hypothetical protein
LIKLKIDTRKLDRLVRQLKDANQDIMVSANDAIVDLDKIIHEEYERSIDEFVYSEYKPMKYERTYHLRGKHGAAVREINMQGAEKHFRFYIDEDSKDPVDGETWREKANKIESGQMRMNPESFARPFVEQTQERLEWQLKRTGNETIRKMRRIIGRVGR